MQAKVASRVWGLITLCLLLSIPATGIETQAWANLILGRFPLDKVYTELDLERKVLLGDEEKWRNLDGTGLIEYYRNSWIDLTGEATLGSTAQTDDLRTNELTFRIGVRTYFAEHLLSAVGRERIPIRRISIASLFRLENRNFWYSDDSPSQSSQRFRIRLELKAGLNGPDPTAPGAWYILTDAEGFLDLGDEIEERFAQKERGRLGVGYVFDETHRIDLLYIIDRARDTIEQSPTETSQAFDLRYRVTF